MRVPVKCQSDSPSEGNETKEVHNVMSPTLTRYSSATSSIVPVFVSLASDPHRFSHMLFLAHRVTQLSSGLWTKCEASVSAVQYADIDSHSEVACGLQVHGFNSELHVQLRQVYTRDFIPANKSHIPAKDTAL